MYHIKLSFVNRELETLQLYDIFKENYSGTKLFQENNKIDTKNLLLQLKVLEQVKPHLEIIF
jgi:hypothetical protein